MPLRFLVLLLLSLLAVVSSPARAGRQTISYPGTWDCRAKPPWNPPRDQYFECAVGAADNWTNQNMGPAYKCDANETWSADGYSCVPGVDCTAKADTVAAAGGCQAGCGTVLSIGITASGGSASYKYTGEKCTAGTGEGGGSNVATDNSTAPNNAPADVPDKNGNTCNSKGCTCGEGYAPGQIKLGSGSEKWICAKSGDSKGGSAGADGKPPLKTDGTKPTAGQAPDAGGGGDHGGAEPNASTFVGDTGDTFHYYALPGSGTGTGTGGTPGTTQSGPMKIDETGTPTNSTLKQDDLNKAHEDRVKSLTDASNRKSLPFVWSPSLPSGTCGEQVFTAGWLGSFNLDMCPTLEKCRAIWSWCFAFMTALYLWRSTTDGVKGGK